MSFDTLGLSERVLAAVKASGYDQPTPIQAQAIPHALAGRDVLGVAQTGTGKTAAFTLPMLSRLETGRARARMPRTLILEPTRELAAQVEEAFVKYGAGHKLTVALIIGGVSFADQDAKLQRGVDVLIATPGRLLDHFERGKLLLNGIEILVIDEADRMLDMGFIPDIERICKMVPPRRQTLFFSATMAPEITRLTEAFLKDPVRVEVARPASTAATITQLLVRAGSEAADKREALGRVVAGAKGLTNAIVFCNRKRDIGTVQRALQKFGHTAGALHGDLDQSTRTKTLDSFRAGQLPLLVASDVAARGLDIPDVSHVVNYDVPIHAEDYVHRIGRTGRAGRSGTAYTLVSPQDGKYLAAIEALIGRSIPYDDAPATAEAAATGASPEAPGTEGAPRRERGPRRGRPGRSEAPAVTEPPVESRAERPREAAPVTARTEAPRSAPARTAPPARPAAPREEPRRFERARDEAPRRGREDRDDGPSVVGLGDHVPSFLLRPVRLKSERA